MLVRPDSLPSFAKGLELTQRLRNSYVVLSSAKGLLAVYRLKPDGNVRRMGSLSKGANPHSYTRSNNVDHTGDFMTGYTRQLHALQSEPYDIIASGRPRPHSD